MLWGHPSEVVYPRCPQEGSSVSQKPENVQDISLYTWAHPHILMYPHPHFPSGSFAEMKVLAHHMYG